MRTIILLVLVGAFSWVALAMDGWFATMTYTQLRAYTFPVAQGVIVQSGVDQSSQQQSDGFKPELRYAYNVNGHRYEGHGGRTETFTIAADSARIQAETRAWALGAPVVVRYDPGNPANSVLRPGLEPIDLLALMLLGVFNMAAAFLWIALIAETVGLPSQPIVNGGARLFKVDSQFHIRLPRFRPWLTGLIVFFVTQLVAFPLTTIALGHTYGFDWALVVAAWSLVLAATVAVVRNQHRKQESGLGDLTIDLAEGVTRIPLIDKLDRAVALAIVDVADFRWETIERRGPRGSRRFTHRVWLVQRDGDEVLVDEPTSAERAQMLATWLRRIFDDIRAGRALATGA